VVDTTVLASEVAGEVLSPARASVSTTWKTPAGATGGKKRRKQRRKERGNREREEKRGKKTEKLNNIEESLPENIHKFSQFNKIKMGCLRKLCSKMEEKVDD